MEKLLYKRDGDLTCSSRDFDKIFPTLYAYESTDLTPEQINEMKVENLNLATMVKELQRKLDKAYAKIERQEALSNDLGKSLDHLSELWEVLPAHIQSQAILVRDSMKKKEEAHHEPTDKT